MEHSLVSRIVLALVLMILVQFSSYINSCSAFRTTIDSTKRNKEYIKTSCGVTAYRRLCYKSLARHANKIRADPESLAQNALNSTLTFTKFTSRMMKEMSKMKGLKPKQAEAVLHCLTDINDSVEKLQKSMRELEQAAEDSDYVPQINDMKMWMNEALERENKCLNVVVKKGMKGKVKSTLRKRIVKVARLTSNTLALINSYAMAKTL